MKLTETKKPLYKRGWFITLIIISAISFTLGVLDSKNKKENEDQLPLAEQVVKGNKYIDEAIFTEDGLLSVVSIITSNTQENTIAPTSINWSFKTMQSLFEYPEVNEVDILIKVNIIDEERNSTIKDLADIRYTREAFENSTFKEFSDAASKP